MTRTQVFILIILAIAVLAVFAGALFLLRQGGAQGTAVPTVGLATVPPDPLLVNRVQICRQEVGTALMERGWSGQVTLNPQESRLEIRASASGGTGDDVPAGPIWGAFEAALAARAAGCSGYAELVVLAGDYQARVRVEDLLAWESGMIDDGVLSGRVGLTK